MTTTVELHARTQAGHTLIVDAEHTTVPGLAIYELHPAFLAPGANTWRIIHAPSGLAIGTAPSRGNALGGVAQLAPLGDWTLSPAELRAGIDGPAVLWAMHDTGCTALAYREPEADTSD